MAEKTKADMTKLYVGSDKTPFNFKSGIDEKEGERLLAALPPESQRRVNAIADAFAKIDMPLAEELPEELRDPTKLVAFFADATKIAKGELQGISESSKALYRRMKMGDPDMAAVGSLFEGFQVFQVARSVGGFAMDVGEEYLDMLKYAYRKPLSKLTNAQENSSQLRDRPSKAQIVALAAVDEAVMKRLVRTEEVEPPAPAIEPNWLDQAFARANQGWNSLTSSSLGKYIRAFGYAVMDMIGGKGFDLARSLAEVEKAIVAEGPQKTYQQLLDDQLASRREVDKEKRPVVLTLSDIDEVAGLKAAPLFKMIERDTAVATTDGKVAVLKKGGTQLEDVPHNGKPLELATLQQHREDQVNGSIGQHGEEGYGAAVTTVAGALAARTAAGVVGNVVNTRAVTPAVQAAAEYRAAHENAMAVAKRLEKAEAGKGYGGTSLGVEDPAKVRTALSEAEAKLNEARVKMEKHGISTSAVLDAEGNARPKAEVEKLAAEHRIQHMRSQGGLEKKGAQFVDFHQAHKKWINPSLWAGKVGDVIGSVGNTTYNAAAGIFKEVVAKPVLIAGNYVLDTVEGAKNLASKASDAIIGKVEVKSSADWFDARAVGTTSESARTAEHATKAATKSSSIASSFGKGIVKVAKFGRGIPLIGGAIGGGLIMLSGSARADTVDGEQLTYFKQLDHDHKLGKVTDKEYAYYRGLQSAYAAAGFGGFITAGITEAAQNGLEYADPVKMDKYLPESLVKTVKNLVSSEKSIGALPADPALHTLGVKAEQARIAAVAAGSSEAIAKARAAANRGLAFANVRSAEPVGVVRLQEGLPMSTNVSADTLPSLVGA